MATFYADTAPTDRGAPLAKWGRTGLKQRYFKTRIRPRAAVLATDTVLLGSICTGDIFVPALSFQMIMAGTPGATGLAAGGIIKATWKNRDGTVQTVNLYTVPGTVPATGVAWTGPAIDANAGYDVPIGADLTLTYVGALPATTDVTLLLAYIEHADQ